MQNSEPMEMLSPSERCPAEYECMEQVRVQASMTSGLVVADVGSAVIASESKTTEKVAAAQSTGRRVLRVAPNLDPERVRKILVRCLAKLEDTVVEQVLHNLFEDTAHSKADKKGKGKRKREEEKLKASNKKVNVGYGNKERDGEGGPNYPRLALEQLHIDFASITSSRIYTTFRENNNLYAPAYLTLLEDLRRGKFMLKRRFKSSSCSGNDVAGITDSEFNKEKAWLEAIQQDSVPVSDKAEEEVKDDGDGIKCRYCHYTWDLDKLVLCPKAHLICRFCVNAYASNLLRAHDPNIVCMDESGCKLPFPESELQRFLNPELLSLYDLVKEVEAAELEVLDECPLCKYKMAIGSHRERLFRCENERCGAVTCRKCKKLDHSPNNCEGAEASIHIRTIGSTIPSGVDQEHTHPASAEAMSRTLMRQCPKCKKLVSKDSGCNRIVCLQCYGVTCDVCCRVLTGYETRTHFGRGAQKCPLWDSNDEHHSSQAAKEAVRDLNTAHSKQKVIQDGGITSQAGSIDNPTKAYRREKRRLKEQRRRAKKAKQKRANGEIQYS